MYFDQTEEKGLVDIKNTFYNKKISLAKKTMRIKIEDMRDWLIDHYTEITQEDCKYYEITTSQDLEELHAEFVAELYVRYKFSEKK